MRRVLVYSKKDIAAVNDNNNDKNARNYGNNMSRK